MGRPKRIVSRRRREGVVETEGSRGREGRETRRRRAGRENGELGLVFLLEMERRWRVRCGVTTSECGCHDRSRFNTARVRHWFRHTVLAVPVPCRESIDVDISRPTRDSISAPLVQSYSACVCRKTNKEPRTYGPVPLQARVDSDGYKEEASHRKRPDQPLRRGEIR